MVTLESSINRSLDLLYPRFAQKVTTALDACHKMGYPIQIFEGWRSPARQDWLYAQGRTSAGKIVTKARAWESWHQLSLASDLAFFKDGKWSWDGNWDAVLPCFEEQGLESLRPFETCHVQFTSGLDIKVAVALMRSQGLQRVWLEVENSSPAAKSANVSGV